VTKTFIEIDFQGGECEHFPCGMQAVGMETLTFLNPQKFHISNKAHKAHKFHKFHKPSKLPKISE
jgi:hypothetical protein